MKHYRWNLPLIALSVWLSSSIALDRPHACAQSGTLPRAQDTVSYDHVRLAEFITTMSRRLGIAALLIDEATLRGFVTIHKDAPVSKQDVLDLFNAGLRDNGAVLVKSGTTFQIVPVSRGGGNQRDGYCALFTNRGSANEL
jgi:type II secretory pathway component GspD/PulD (secretin)